MASDGRLMGNFVRWHIWLGWLVGIPLLLWTVSGLVMVAKPIEEVRGTDLRLEVPEAALPAGANIAIKLPEAGEKPVTAVSTSMESGRVITRLTHADGSVVRFDEQGRKLGPFTNVEARQLVARQIKGGDRIASVKGFDAADVPLDFRKPVDVWQVALHDGTHVYVGQDSGRIEAVRTRWWRVYDFFWGLHIMDLQTREDAHNPIIIAFAGLAIVFAGIGCVLLFRRRKAHPKIP